MIPVVVKTFPINGQDNISLNSDVKIYFDSALAPINFEDIRVENMNSGELVEFQFEQYDELINIFIQDRNAHGDNNLCGLTTYQVTIKNATKSSAPMQKGSHILRFKTEAENPADIPKTEVSTNISYESNFAVSEVWPADGQKHISPKYIKVVFTDVIDPQSVCAQAEVDEKGEVVKSQTVYLLKGSPENIQEQIMLNDYKDEFMISVAVDKIKIEAKVKGSTLLIFPIKTIKEGTEEREVLASLDDNSQYSIIINNIAGGTPYRSSIKQVVSTFWTKFSPLYIDANEIVSTPYYGLVAQNRVDNTDFIYGLIKGNSLLAEAIAAEAGTTESLKWAEEELSPCIAQFVRYKTLYDLVFDKYITIVSSSEDKKLSDLTISYANKPAYLKSLLDDLDFKRAAAEDEIRKFGQDNAPMAVCIKGSAVDAEYDFMNRAISDLEGNKSW